MNITEKKKLKLLQIEKARYILNIELENGVITEKDIMSLISVNKNFGIRKGKSQYSYKHTVLMSIFNCPFVLCDQPILSLEIKKILPIFLDARYNTELDELNLCYKQGYINDKELEEETKLLKFCYYGSSNDGKSILKNGHVDNVLDSKVKVR